MSDHRSRQPFRTTHWSLILQASEQADSQNARQALAELCTIYWPPLYTFLRCDGHSATDSEDLVQGFLTTLIERDDLARIDPGKGRFRSFLLASLKHYVSNQRDHHAALKRGGGVATIPLDVAQLEHKWSRQPTSGCSADLMFDRQWAETLVQSVSDQLLAEQPDAKHEVYRQLSAYLSSQSSLEGYQQVAARLGMTVDAVKMAVSRMRRRYREILRERIARTLDDPGEIDEEIRYLVTVLARNS